MNNEVISMSKFDDRYKQLISEERPPKIMRAEDHERLVEIKDEMKNMLEEAKELIRRNASDWVYQRAKSYWIGHIAQALDDESDYMGSATVTFQNTIDEIQVEGAEEDYDKDEDTPEINDESNEKL